MSERSALGVSKKRHLATPRRKSDRVPLLILLSIVSISLAAATAHHRGKLDFLLSGFNTFSAPVLSTLTQANGSLRRIWDGYIALTHAQKENKALRLQVKRLEAEQVSLTEKLLEAQRLAMLNSVAEEYPQKYLLSHVIARDASSWSRTILIDGGERQGMQRNCVVMGEGGLVGRILETTHNTARVLLITDGRSAVDALIQRSRAGGVVVGRSSGLCKMKYLSPVESARVGDWVISSGMGGIFPKGLPIGTITKVTTDGGAPFPDVVVTPVANLERLEEVLVAVEQ